MEASPEYALRTLRIIVALTAVATAAVGLRFLSRWLSRAPLAADDGLIVLAWLFMLGLVVDCGYMYAAVGLGGPEVTMTPEQLGAFFQSFFASLILYYGVMLPTKLSILALYIRIFVTRTFRAVALVVALVCVAWCIGGMVPTIFLCHTLAKEWDVTDPGGCHNPEATFMAVTISNLLTDVIVLVLPVAAVWNLKLSLRHRLIVSGIFLVGGLACVASLLRIITQSHVAPATLIDSLVTCSLWTAIEPAFAILSACLPCMRPLLPARGTLSKWSSRFSGNNTPSASSKDRKSWYGMNSLGFDSRHRTLTTATATSISDLPLQAVADRDQDRHLNHDWDWAVEHDGKWTRRNPRGWDREQQGGRDGTQTGRAGRTQTGAGHPPRGIMVLNEITVVGDSASDTGEDDTVHMAR